jgi:hypothetical protein
MDPLDPPSNGSDIVEGRVARVPRLSSVSGDGRPAPADELLRAVVAQIDRHRRELNADPGLRQVRLTVRFREGRVRYAQIERVSEAELDD